MDKPLERSASDHSLARDPEHFKYEMKFLDKVSELIESLKKYGDAVRISHEYEIIGMDRENHDYPPSLDRYIGEKEFSSTTVTTVVEGYESSTTIEMFGSFGRIYISRSATLPEDTGDNILSNEGEPFPIERIPNSEINDFLYSLNRHGVSPAEARKASGDSSSEELVSGYDMRDALESAALSSLTDYTYELGDGLYIWFRINNSLGEDKLSHVTLSYFDYDMEKRSVDISLDQGFEIKFRSPGNETQEEAVLYPDKTDYAIALRVIREATHNLLQPVEQVGTVSLGILPDELLDELSSNND